MFLMLSKKPRKSDRSRSNRFRAKLKAKNARRRARVYQAHRALASEAREGRERNDERLEPARVPAFSRFHDP